MLFGKAAAALASQHGHRHVDGDGGAIALDADLAVGMGDVVQVAGQLREVELIGAAALGVDRQSGLGHGGKGVVVVAGAADQAHHIMRAGLVDAIADGDGTVAGDRKAELGGDGAEIEDQTLLRTLFGAQLGVAPLVLEALQLRSGLRDQAAAGIAEHQRRRQHGLPLQRRRHDQHLARQHDTRLERLEQRFLAGRRWRVLARLVAPAFADRLDEERFTEGRH